MGKIIVIEGTDCSGKETQSKMLVESLKNEGLTVQIISFQVYGDPTGKIIGGPYLGKPQICESWFKEGPDKVSWKVSSLYYAADRLYHLEDIKKAQEENDIVILDRYIYSNMAHQGGKVLDSNLRKDAYKFIEELEFNLLGLPKPDAVIFLHMPYEYGEILRNNRNEPLDGNESDENHLRHAEKTYLELKDIYDFIYLSCIKNNQIKTIDEIHEEIYTLVKELIKSKKLKK